MPALQALGKEVYICMWMGTSFSITYQSIPRISTWTHFENEARGHSEVARQYDSEKGIYFWKNPTHFADLDQSWKAAL